MLAQEVARLPEIPSSGKSIEAFIPKGWKQITKATGDLNDDNLEDVVLAIQSTSPKKLIKNHSELGPKVLNMNDRCLIILLKEAGEYVLAEESDTFLPRENDRHSPCEEDPLMEHGGISIVNGILQAKFGYQNSCGDNTGFQNFEFKYDNRRFRLIRFDNRWYSSLSGEETIESADLIAGKKLVTTGGNVFDKTKNNPVSFEHNIIEGQLYLEDFSAGPQNFFIK